ncbi:MAG: hypothetical protein WAO52_10105 [Prolixibacteraceae bacterium]
MNTPKWLLILLVVSQMTISCSRPQKMGTLVFIDKSDSLSMDTKSYLLPYLEHFGISYEIADINAEKLSESADDYSLVIIGHDMNLSGTALKLIRRIQSKGAGVVSFDPDWPSDNMDIPTTDSAKLIFFSTDHYITALHEKTDTIKCSIKLPFRNISTDTIKSLVFADGKPLLLVSANGLLKSVTYTSMEWMKSSFVGPMMGLDDCLWRSFVWAARKPFVMRSLPPLVTMRVDDVAGRGELMQKSPLYWINTANKYGFKPWLGLFIYNLNPTAIKELRGYLLNNQATASAHAFGRPNRVDISNKQTNSYTGSNSIQTNTNFYYAPDALPLREKTYDEFIYFDHQAGKPWSDEEAIRGLEAIDKWYSKNQPLPMSKYFLAHWYEMGSNIIPYISQKWGMEYIGINHPINEPYADNIPWIKGAPFKLYEKSGSVTSNDKAVYYADTTTINGYKFFNCMTEIRDDADYEWAPDNQTEMSAAKGIRQLRRALSSMALAVLFTHETDYIYLIKPESWEGQIRLISEGIKDYNPMKLTMDEALKIVRAYKTSHLIESVFQKAGNNIDISLDGHTDTKTFVYVFTEGKETIQQRLVEIPEFNESKRISLPVK